MNCIEIAAIVLLLLNIKDVSQTPMLTILVLFTIGRILRKRSARAKLKSSTKKVLEKALTKI